MQMPNGDSHEYNQQWCKSIHERIERDFTVVHKRVDKMDARLWGLLVMGFIQVVGIVGILLAVIL